MMTNLTTGKTIARDIVRCDTFLKRGRGLMFRRQGAVEGDRVFLFVERRESVAQTTIHMFFVAGWQPAGSGFGAGPALPAVLCAVPAGAVLCRGPRVAAGPRARRRRARIQVLMEMCKVKRKTGYSIRNVQTAVVLVLLLGLVVPAAAQEPTSEAPVYVVRPGDTLSAIAQRFDTTVDAIVNANDIVNPSLINVGQKLIIPTSQPELVPSTEPAADARVHVVNPGETLPALALYYRTSIWALREANHVHRLGMVAPGQELTITPPALVLTDTPTLPQIGGSPSPVVQGQTVVVQVESGSDLDLKGWFLGQDLHFVGQEGSYWALAGVDPLTSPGGYPVVLKATEVGSGDLLTVHDTFTVTAGSFPTYNVVVPIDRQNLLDPTLSQAEAAKVNAVFGGISQTKMWTGTFGTPLAGELRITASFGQRRSYNNGPVSTYHAGWDLGADAGMPVYAPMTATVALAEPLQVRGNAVILDHGLGVFTGYWHLSEIDVTAGEVVTAGQVIGLVGNTGLSTGPHLHWEMQVFGVPVDPMQWTRRTFP
jgi:murein DD-endopeptidase MepM/ murein hydrolase activator NlpD